MYLRETVVLLACLLLTAFCAVGIDCGGGSAHDKAQTDGDDDASPPDFDDDETDDDNDDTTPHEDEAFVTAGTFLMGAEPEYLLWWNDELPRHEVLLSAYYIDVAEVTNDQFADYLNADNPENVCEGNPCAVDMHVVYALMGLYDTGDSWRVDSGWEHRPVVGVTWYGAAAYCAALGKQLPTEAQWEKAAKGAAEHYIYPWGDDWQYYSDNWRDGDDPYENGSHPPTTPVCFYDGTRYEDGFQTEDGRSPYGLCDMAGNAWEWVADWYDGEYYFVPPAEGWIDPVGPAAGTVKGMRGGCWADGTGAQMTNATSYRHRTAFPYRYDEYTGFRCARPAE